MSKNKYCLNLNSQTTDNRDTTGGLGAYKYYVNWDAILGFDRSKRYQVEWALTTLSTFSVRATTFTIGCFFGSSLSYDQKTSQTEVIGAIVPQGYPSMNDTTEKTLFTYQHSIDEGNSFTCYYPTNNYITINVKTLAGVKSANMGHYSLFLYFTEIDEKDW